MRKILQPLMLLAFLQAGFSVRADAPPIYSKSFISDPVTIDRVYKSMKGPFVLGEMMLSDDPGRGELLWLKSAKVEFITGQDDAPRPRNYLCHSHIIQEASGRLALFSLIQGQNTVELPGNLGVPAHSMKPLEYAVQILNLDEVEKPFDVRIKATVDYLRDTDVTTKMVPLYEINLPLRIPIDKETAGVVAGSHAEDCDAGLHSKDGSVEIVPSSVYTLMKDPKGDFFSYHWNVPPGRHTYAYDIQRGEIQADGEETIHFATVHLHPYGRSVELWDLTRNTSVLRVDVKNFPENGGIERVNYFHSEKGVAFNANHRYRITAEYDNPTQANVDAMAGLYLYLHDKDFDEARRKWNEDRKLRESRDTSGKRSKNDGL